MTETKEQITHEGENAEAWICLCGNRTDSDGFFACDKKGNEVSPDKGSSWTNLYVCGKCGRIVNQDTLEVVGQNPNFKRLD